MISIFTQLISQNQNIILITCHQYQSLVNSSLVQLFQMIIQTQLYHLMINIMKIKNLDQKDGRL